MYISKNKIIKFAQKYDYQKSKYCASNSDCKASAEVCLTKSFETSVPLDFENIVSYAFGHYKEYLKKYYGDYMTMPPENERFPKHSVDAEIEDEFIFHSKKT